MNPIGEFDLELLEDYLDDALSAAQVQHVARRLVEEPELALAMHELRAARVLRAAVWRSMEPKAGEAADVASGVGRFVRREWRTRARRMALHVGGAVAAAVVLFVTGWLLRGPANPATPRTRAASLVVNTVSRGDPPPPFHVALIDRQGRVIPVQKFWKMDEARAFARDLMQYETRRRDAEQGSAMLISDHF